MNPDLWQRLLELCEYHDVEFNWVPGHAGNAENEHCDQLAMKAALGPDLSIDVGYEASGGSSSADSGEVVDENKGRATPSGG